jgi:hypothetical protein
MRCAAFAGRGIEDYLFHEMTTVYKYRAVGSNWKLNIDAFAEFYHAPVLYAKQHVGDESSKLWATDSRGCTESMARTAWCRRGGMAPLKDVNMVKPIGGSCAAAPWSVGLPRHQAVRCRRVQSVPPPHVGRRLFVFFLNFMVLVGAGLVHHVPLRPTAYNRHIFEGTLYFVPLGPRDRMRQELAAVTRVGCRTATR